MLLLKKLQKNAPVPRWSLQMLDMPLIKIHEALSQHAVNVVRWAYYDNPETYVPGGYSAVAADVMSVADGVLFANSNLAHTKIYREPGQEIDLTNKHKVGVGYYPLEQVKKSNKQT